MAEGVGFLVGHVFAIILGLVLIIAGLAMGVTLVLLPVGLPVGLVGILVVLWGLFGRTGKAPTTGGP
jgi:hypothetical protein